MSSALYPSRRVSATAALVVLVMVMSSLTWTETDAARYFGMPGTVTQQTALVATNLPALIAVLAKGTRVNVLCRFDPLWVNVHVWATGQNGLVTAHHVQCRHMDEYAVCRVPFCQPD